MLPLLRPSQYEKTPVGTRHRSFRRRPATAPAPSKSASLDRRRSSSGTKISPPRRQRHHVWRSPSKDGSPIYPSLSPGSFPERVRTEVADSRRPLEEAVSYKRLEEHLELAGRTLRLEREVYDAIEGTISAYSRMRRTYAFQRDTYLPLFFLREAEGGRGLPFIMERAAKVFIFWLDRELVRKMARGWHRWRRYIRYLRWLRRLVRGLHVLARVWRQFTLRRWRYFVYLHRQAEDARCAVVLQRTTREHFGRKRAYHLLRWTSAFTIQMRWRMHVAVDECAQRRVRRNGARTIQRMYRWRKARIKASIIIQAMARARESRKYFLFVRRQQTIMARFMKTRWARKLFISRKRAALFASMIWRGKIARRLHWRLHNARIIQKRWRGDRSRLRVWHMRRARHVIRVQTAFRAWTARKLRAKRWWGLIIVQRELLRWCAKRRYRRMLWGRNRAKKEARIRVSVRPIQGELHVLAAVRPGRIEWTWGISGKARTRSATAKYIVKKGLELHIFRVKDSRVYRGFLTHEQLKYRHAMYARRGKKFPGGVYSKPFISLLFDQVTICKRTGRATVVQTTRSERGYRVAGFVIRRDHEEEKDKLFIVQVFRHLDEYVFRAFDPERCWTFRGELRLHHIRNRLTQTDAHLALSDEKGSYLKTVLYQGPF